MAQIWAFDSGRAELSISDRIRDHFAGVKGSALRRASIDPWLLTIASIHETCAFYERVLAMDVVTFGGGQG